MAQAIQIGPRRFFDAENQFALLTYPSPTIPLLVEQASTEDVAAAAHLMWWRSPEALAFRTGIKIEHATGIISRWSLAASTQGRWWIAVELWADAQSTRSNKQTIPRHMHPSDLAAQLDGRVVESMRRAA